MALLEVQDLSLEFAAPGGAVQAVNGISYDVEPGEIVAIVDESGSGKTAAALAALGLIPQPPGRIVSGRIYFGGQNLLNLSEEELRRIRGPGISMVFQEPMTSLNPSLTIGRQLTEAMRLHLGYSKAAAIERAVELMTLVGISDPQGRLAQYPHQFSGGMRQRVMIAIALACKPQLIIADEPTTALDVTIQAQILSLLKNLTEQLGVALVIINHNLGIVARYAARVNVMYAGRIVEYGLVGDVFRKPSHPYAILAEAGLSFLGLGVKASTPTWGLMLAEGRSFISRAWWVGLFPGFAIMLTVLSINFLGDALRDYLDVREASDMGKA